VIHAAGRQVVEIGANLQDEGAREGLQDLFEKIGDRVPHSQHGRQRFVQGTSGLGALHEGHAGSKAGVAAQVTNGGKQFFPESVTGGTSEAPAAMMALVRRQQGAQGVLEQVAGGGGESMDADRLGRVAGAKRVRQDPAREVVDASAPQDGRLRLNPIRPTGDLDRALKLPTGYPKADPEAGVGRRGQARRQRLPCTGGVFDRPGFRQPDGS